MPSTPSELQQLKNVYQSVPVGLCFLDTNLRYVYLNDALAKINGVPSKDHIGKKFEDILPLKRAKILTKLYTNVLLTGKPIIDRELEFELVKNKKRYFLASYYPVLQDSRTIGVSAVIQEVTDRKQLEDKLRYQLQLTRNIMDSAGIAIFVSGPNGTLTFVNTEVEDLFGYTLEELQTKRLHEIIHYKHLDGSPFPISDCPLGQVNVDRNAVRDYEGVFWRKDGSPVWCICSNVPIIENDHVVGEVMTLQDISERKLDEENMHYHKSLLEAQKEVAPLGILIVSPNGEIVSYNTLFSQMWKLSEKLHNTGNDEDALFEAMNQLVRPKEFLEKVTHTYKKKTVSYDKIYFTDGRVFDRYGSPLNGEDGHYYGYVWFYYDITEREQLAKQKDEFIAIASHELKTPVTSIKAYTQVLQRRFQKSGDMNSAELLLKMNMQLDKLTNLISDLLDVSKIEGGRIRFKRIEFDINDLVSEVVDEVQRTSHSHKIQIELSPVGTFWGDRDRIGQVITNFLTNAIKYSPHADNVIVRSSITINKRKKPVIYVEVEDFGVGLPARDTNKVFERFYRAEGTKLETYPGLGLGLYISSEIIKRHAGEIGVRSVKGKGSTFYFTLPTAKD